LGREAPLIKGPGSEQSMKVRAVRNQAVWK
jgi:hypothetical protein